jgi:hypothetical protein
MNKEFRFFDLSLPSRLAIAAALYCLGALAGLLSGLPFLGFALAALGWIPLALRAASNRPDDQGLEEWRLVGIEEVDRLDEGIRAARKIRKKAASKGGVVALVLLSPLLFFGFVGAAIFGRVDIQYGMGLAVVYLVPALFFGRLKVFLPAEIDLKLPSFRAVLSRKPPEGLSVVPYIRFDKDEKGGDVPEDLRLLIEARRKPADLVGIQLQAAINEGPNGKVPYLYAVVLTKGRGQSWNAASRFTAHGYEVEAGGDDTWGTVVIRQDTKGGGYHTSPEDCRRLAEICQGLLQRLCS